MVQRQSGKTVLLIKSKNKNITVNVLDLYLKISRHNSFPLSYLTISEPVENDIEIHFEEQPIFKGAIYRTNVLSKPHFYNYQILPKSFFSLTNKKYKISFCHTTIEKFTSFVTKEINFEVKIHDSLKGFPLVHLPLFEENLLKGFNKLTTIISKIRKKEYNIYEHLDVLYVWPKDEPFPFNKQVFLNAVDVFMQRDYMVVASLKHILPLDSVIYDYYGKQTEFKPYELEWVFNKQITKTICELQCIQLG